MPTIYTIDGLARSGSTWLTAILNSHPECRAWRGVFYEPLAMKGGKVDGSLAEYMLQLPLEPSNRKVDVYSKKHPLSFAKKYIMGRHNLRLDYDALWDLSLSSFEGRNQYECFSREELIRFREEFDTGSVEGLDQLYQRLAGNSKAACLRWNQGSWFALPWLARANHRLIVPVRDPRDRACSSRLAHNNSMESSIRSAKRFATHLENIIEVVGGEFVYVIHYEDLLDDFHNEVRKLFSWMGLDSSVRLSQLTASDGSLHRIETSDLVKEGGSHRVGITGDLVRKTSVRRYEKELTESEQQSFHNELCAVPLYKRYFTAVS